MDEIQVAFILDDNYILPGLLAAYSLASTHKGRSVRIHILKTGQYPIQTLFGILENEKLKIEINEIKLDEEERKNFVRNRKSYVSITSQLKFRLPGLLPHLKRVLYIDSDTLISGDLLELWNVNLKSKNGAFIPDMHVTLTEKGHLQKLGIENHEAYFNSGVMLLNLEEMRRTKAQERLIEYRKTGYNKWMDQDAFNVILGDKAIFLDLRYNFLVELPQEFSREEICVFYKRDLPDLSLTGNNDFKIVHYASRRKPWNTPQTSGSEFWRQQLAGFIQNMHEALSSSDNKWRYLSRIIVSLTCDARDIAKSADAVRKIKQQSLKPAKIILWLPRDEYRAAYSSLPKELALLMDDLFAIRFCDTCKGYARLLPALEAYPDCLIVAADAAQEYNGDWLLELFLSYLEDPAAVHSHQAHMLELNEDGEGIKWNYNQKHGNPDGRLFPLNKGGVLYPPRSFTQEVFRVNVYKEKFASWEDLWFWAMATMKGRSCKVAKTSTHDPSFSQQIAEEQFGKIVTDSQNIQSMTHELFFYYPFIKAALWKRQNEISKKR